MPYSAETENGRRIIHATTKVLLEMDGQQHEMGPEAFTDEVKRRVELELPGADLPRAKLAELTEILMRAGTPRE